MRVTIFIGAPGSFPRARTSLMAKGRCPEWLPLHLPLGWVCSDRPRGAQVCLPGRMDRRWEGLLSHQPLPAAQHGTVPRECHLHLHRARAGRCSQPMPPAGRSLGQPMPPAFHVLSHSALPELGLPTLFSSQNPGDPHSHDVVSTWCSLSKTVSSNSIYFKHIQSWCSLLSLALSANTFLESALVDVRYEGLLQILVSAIPLESMPSYGNTEELIHHV